MTVHTSNRLPVLAERIRQANDKAKAASVESAEQYLEAGHLLVEAKAECPHGEWGPFLEKAGVHERQAQRLMKLARSGLKSDTVSEMGGVKAALAYLAQIATHSVDTPAENHDDTAREFIERRQLQDDAVAALVRELTPTGWNAPEDLSFDEWLARGQAILSLAASLPSFDAMSELYGVLSKADDSEATA